MRTKIINKKSGGMRIEDLLLNTRVLGVIVLLISLISVMPSAVHAQNTEEHKRSTVHAMTLTQLQDRFYKTEIKKEISVNVHEITLEQALRVIARKTGLRLSYRGDIMVDKIISLQNENITVSDALANVLDNTGLDYKISQDGYLMITEKEVLPHDNFQETITGTVFDTQTGEALPGVNVVIEGTSTGTSTQSDGTFELEVPSLETVLVFSYIGYQRQVVEIDGRTELNISLVPEIVASDELVVVGYGVQRRSDITGSVASIPRERLEMVPNLNIAQAIQGAVPGIMVQTTSAGAAPSEVLMVRGRNSITASNDPLIVVDGIPYSGNLMDINPNDVESIEVLKDASAAAIYGSRGANGVILITTQEGVEGRARISYDARFSVQSIANFPEVLSGDEFFHYKEERVPGALAGSERAVYEAGEWVNWMDLGTRRGYSNHHNLSVSGGFDNTTYYFSGNLLDVQGLTLNDDFQRLTGRMNLTTDISNWLTLGTRSSLSYSDQSGVAPSYSGLDGLLLANPLTIPYNEDGSLTIRPAPESPNRAHPLAETLYQNNNESYDIVTNNFARIDFPFLSGLSNQINIGIRRGFNDIATYRGRNTLPGLQNRGEAFVSSTNDKSTTIENILTFISDFGDHSISTTGLLSYENNYFNVNSTSATGFPNDLLTWNAMSQADVIMPESNIVETTLISQMMRMNYSYDSRYLLTFTIRRDGFSGFGKESRWGVFPSIALGWNLADEDFFPWNNVINELKPRVSFGLNGNQAVGAYETIARLRELNMVSLGETLAGFVPSRLAQENLGWEASKTFNVGVDFAILDHRFTGEVNYYHTNTVDLLLDRTISAVHGITSITQNIGETENRGLELSINSRNVTSNNFSWSTNGNISFVKNKIVDIYGDGLDDIANQWFIGQPIRVNYDFIFDGVWQLDEADEAAEWGSHPGYAKIRDVTGDGQISSDDRQIIGQQDPKYLWGLTNTFNYRNFGLNIFIHGVHGVTRSNSIMNQTPTSEVLNNVFKRNWWTQDNPSNDYWMNDRDAHRMGGAEATIYESASFIRIKDVTFSYSLPTSLVQRIGIDKLDLYTTGRNLATFTDWRGTDPELSSQTATPLQREIVFGLNLGF